MWLLNKDCANKVVQRKINHTLQVGANMIAQATPTCFLTTFVITFWEIFLKYFWNNLEFFFTNILIFFLKIILIYQGLC